MLESRIKGGNMNKVMKGGNIFHDIQSFFESIFEFFVKLFGLDKANTTPFHKRRDIWLDGGNKRRHLRKN